MNHQPSISDSDVIDGLYMKYLKFFGLWKVINDYRTTGKRNAIIKFQLAMTLMDICGLHPLPYRKHGCSDYWQEENLRRMVSFADG
ncbi:unnamed protein product [Nezara viridula]|uniref:Uncharacterized protein n=1 Tax=Nezara viridula TaxID=85310 RepID=A0A9P0MYC4_NEZVI|nr:unnamed protein product [Nezara viridula]